jgi:hypothetical protein
MTAATWWGNASTHQYEWAAASPGSGWTQFPASTNKDNASQILAYITAHTEKSPVNNSVIWQDVEGIIQGTTGVPATNAGGTSNSLFPGANAGGAGTPASTGGVTTTGAVNSVVAIALETAAVVVLSLVAGSNDKAGKAIIWFFIALWVIYLVTNGSNIFTRFDSLLAKVG